MEFSSQYNRCQFPLWFLLWRNAGNQLFPRFPVAFQDSEWPLVKTLLDVTLCSIQSQGSRGGVELIVLAFLLCGLGSIPGLDTMCGFELVDCAIFFYLYEIRKNGKKIHAYERFASRVLRVSHARVHLARCFVCCSLVDTLLLREVLPLIGFFLSSEAKN